jgi:hypothetical protein
VHWLRDIATLLALGWLLLVALTTARAQETPEATACTGIETEGGSTVIIGQVQVTLPPGDYTRTLAAPNVLDQGASICHVETGASITISGQTCEELSRESENAEEDALLDEILESCVIVPTPTAEPTPAFACPDGEAISGGATVTIADNLQVTLPAGNFVIDVEAGADGELAQICNPDEQYSIILRVSDCTTPVIAPPNDPDATVKQEIMASCVTLSPTPTPDPAAVVTTIQPPNTGDAGLPTD